VAIVITFGRPVYLTDLRSDWYFLYIHTHTQITHLLVIYKLWSPKRIISRPYK